MLKVIMTRSALIAFACALSFAAHAYAVDPKPITVPAGDLTVALETLAKQAHVELVYQTEQLKGMHTNGVSGNISPQEAVTKLLEGTSLIVRTDSSGAMLIAGPLPTGPVPSTRSSTDENQSPPQPNAKPTADAAKSKQGFWDRFRLAQVDQGPSGDASSVEKGDKQASKKKSDQLEEVVVTGSRIPRVAQEGAQELRVYTREQIDQSGQTTVTDFLNTLPAVSLATTEIGIPIGGGATTVNLRGLPFGATLVLLNGRRIETSGSASAFDIFDLNNIPLAAVDRIEIVADGSSAVYGSDAIAGVVNIILKANYTGAEVSVRTGIADDQTDSNSNVAWGKSGERGAISIVGTYQRRSELEKDDRALTSSNNYTSYGGPNNNFPECHPGNVFSVDGVTPLPGLGGATYAAVPAGFQGKPSIQEFQPTAGTLNTCSLARGGSIIPATDRVGLYLQGHYHLAPSIELFTELLYSRVREYLYTGFAGLFGQSGFQSFTVSPSNPYNPFGTTVGVGDAFTNTTRAGEFEDTRFFRPLIGLRGGLGADWQWEASTFESVDSTTLTQPMQIVNTKAIQNALNSADPSVALNPFTAGSAAPQAELQSFYQSGISDLTGRGTAVNGFLRGTLLELPSGRVEVVAGGEYDHDAIYSHTIIDANAPPNTWRSWSRGSYAVFGEVRIPIVSGTSEPRAPDKLALTAAGRYDHYSDFGSTTNPQYGLEWRPTKGLLARATYSTSFKAPSLFTLYLPQVSFPNIGVTDPVTGQQVAVTDLTGGNPSLHPQTGKSWTVGLVYATPAVPNLQLSATLWHIRENNAIQSVSPQFIVDSAADFPGRVTRNAQGTITAINDTYANFGSIDLAGVDYQVSYRLSTPVGVWNTSLSATQTYRYYAALTPGGTPADGVSMAQDSGDWAPRWKSTVTAGWARDPYTVGLVGRYVGRYQDYDSTREIGNFWLCDAYFHFEIGRALAPPNTFSSGAYLEFGGSNVFNKLPQFSNFNFGFTGYDPTQADIRGRFIYGKLGIKW